MILYFGIGVLHVLSLLVAWMFREDYLPEASETDLFEWTVFLLGFWPVVCLAFLAGWAYALWTGI